MVVQTNKYTELHLTLEDQKLKGRERLWQPTSKRELYAYFAVVIYIGLVIKPAIKDYQGSLFSHRSKYKILRYILKNWFKQIDRYIRCITLQPKNNGVSHTIFDQVDELSKHLQILSCQYYSLKAYFAINKTIKRFIGRALEIVNILSKPTPKGFKIQVLAN